MSKVQSEVAGNENCTVSGADVRIPEMDLAEVAVAARMSKRLVTDADMLGGVCHEIPSAAGSANFGVPGRFRCVADVGCDHGYVSIYLVQKGIAETAIAMDVRKGPLSMAENNVREYGLEEKIDLRLSDGLSLLNKDEADALVIAGMGGKLMISILEKKDIRELGIKTAILQPQSDIPKFRQFLREKGYLIENEKIVFEDGKYYFPMRVKAACLRQGNDTEGYSESYSFPENEQYVKKVMELFPSEGGADILRICNRYGEHNILRRNELLKTYLEHGLEVNKSILASLKGGEHPEREEALLTEQKDIELVLGLYDP